MAAETELTRRQLVLAALPAVALLGWMAACQTGKKRLRAGLPANWLVGDKIGTGERNAINDVAIATPPGRAPILITAYMSDSASALSVLEAAHADVARLVRATFERRSPQPASRRPAGGRCGYILWPCHST